MEMLKNKNQLSEDELQKRINVLPSNLQAEFLQATDSLLQKESEIFLKMIQESRDEINSILQGLHSDHSNVGSNDKYEDGFNSTNKLAEFVEKREKHKKYSNIHTDSRNQEAVEKYLREVGRHKDKAFECSTDQEIPNYARPTTSGSHKSVSALGYKIRMDNAQTSDYSSSVENEISKPSNVNVNDYSKKQEELLRKLKEQDTQIATERERQKKLIEKKKAKRNNKIDVGVEGVASNIIDQSRGADEKELQNKLQQEKIVQDKLEKVRATRTVKPLDERSATIVGSKFSNRNQNSLFEESKNELTLRPKTGENKSPVKTPEEIKLRTPTKSGWSDSGTSKDIATLFEINLLNEKLEAEQKAHAMKRLKKKKESREVNVQENKGFEFITIEE